jgi:sugar phosphate isomerase/epimerase
MRPHRILTYALAVTSILLSNLFLSAEDGKFPPGGVFARENLMAWCIVPFDARQRGPEERAAMLERLGLTGLAYDYRGEHIPTFDDEFAALAKHKIRFSAFWCGGVSLSDPLKGAIELALETLKRNKTQADLWVLIDEAPLKELPQEEKVAKTAAAIQVIADEAKKSGCRVGLYNHGGWFGEPENQIAILKQVKADNVGIVYNFHHGHEHLDRLPGLFTEMLPYLHCVNLNGMQKGGPKILPVGDGEEDLKILQMIKASGYTGPIGILGHRAEIDAEVALRLNLEGLKKLLIQMNDQPALTTY